MFFMLKSCSSWGAAAMCSGAVNNFSQLVACRCLLGIFESVFGCGAPYFLSLFYQRRELGFRLSLLLGMSPVANCFASALAYGITQIQGSLEPWRYLFIIGKRSLSVRCKVPVLTSRRGSSYGTFLDSCIPLPSRLSRIGQVPR